MTVITETPAPTGGTRTGRDPGRFAGVAFGVMFLLGYLLWGLGPTVYGSDLATFQADSTGGSTGTVALVMSHLVMPLAALFLLWTVARLRTALDGAVGGSSVAGQVAFGSAVVIATGFCVLGAAANVAQIVAGGDYIDGFPADPGVGYGIALVGGYVGNATVWGASALMVAIGAAAWRTRLLPRWLIWVGYVTSPLLIVGWYYGIPVLLLCLWVAVAGLTVQTDRG